MDFFKEVEQRLDMPPADRQKVMRELRSHFEGLKVEMVNSGMDETEAMDKAARRLGNPQDIAHRIQSVHCRASRRSLLLAIAAPIGLYLLYMADVSLETLGGKLLFSIFSLVMAAGSIREIYMNRRPIWIASWLPTGLIVICMIVVPYFPSLMEWLSRYGGLPLLVALILPPIIYILVLLRKSHYCIASQSGLFGFIFYTTIMGLYLSGNTEYKSLCLAGTGLLQAVTILLYGRSATPVRRLLMLYIGMFITIYWVLVGSIIGGYPPQDTSAFLGMILLSIVYTSIFFIWITGPALLVERILKRKHPEFIRS